MKILHWDEMFHPAFGYQINVLAKFQAQQGHDVTIISSDRINSHPKFSNFSNSVDSVKEDLDYTLKYGVKIIRVPWYRVVSGRVIYKRGYIKEINKVNADVIMCHTNDTLSAMTIAKKYKKINAPLVFDNHMLEMASKNPMKKFFRLYFKTFITPIIVKNDWKVIRTQNDNYVNKFLGIPEKQTPFISFGSDTTLFYPRKDVKSEFRFKHAIYPEDFVIVYTGKLDEAKGGKLLANTFKKKYSTEKNVVLIIVGNTEGEYGNEVEEIFNESENRLIRFPTQKYTDLAQFYQAADLCVFAKQCSLSFYDAQACGLPVISEANNINIERCSHDNGFNFKPDNINDFREKITWCINMNSDELKRMSDNSLNYIKNNFDYKVIAEKYTQILIEEMKKNNQS